MQLIDKEKLSDILEFLKFRYPFFSRVVIHGYGYIMFCLNGLSMDKYSSIASLNCVSCGSISAKYHAYSREFQ